MVRLLYRCTIMQFWADVRRGGFTMSSTLSLKSLEEGIPFGWSVDDENAFKRLVLVLVNFLFLLRSKIYATAF